VKGNDLRRVPIEGELTIQTAPEHKQRLLAVLQDGSGLRVDLSGVSELDTAGLQVLLLAQREGNRRDLAVELSDPSPSVAEVLAVAGQIELEM
jgi:anti-anti-sigma factor